MAPAASDEPAEPAEAGRPSSARIRPTAIVWITLAVVVFAGIVAFWMYWLSGMLIRVPG